jgi:hypothetical protein
MKYEVFLWTRTENIDYKFDVFPAHITREQKNEFAGVITNIFRDIGNNKEFFSNRLREALYSFNFYNDLILMFARPSLRVDSSHTTIWEVSGIVVDQSQMKELKYYLNYISSNDLIWGITTIYLGKGSLTIGPVPSPIFVMDLDLHISGSTSWDDLYELIYIQSQNTTGISFSQLVVPFTQDFELVVKTIATCPKLPWISFAFGPTKMNSNEPFNNCRIRSVIDIDKPHIQDIHRANKIDDFLNH